MEFLDQINKLWLKWTSLPFVFGLDLTLYVFTASELNDLPNISIGWKEYLLLSIPFFLLFVGYFVWCCVHNLKGKKADTKAVSDDAADPDAEAPAVEKAKSTPAKTIWLIASGCFVALAILAAILVFTVGNKQQYVIWTDQYNKALTTQVHKEFYLEGQDVKSEGGKLTGYDEDCIVTIKYVDEENFTITCGGKLLGVTPDKNGVGYAAPDSSSEQNSCTRWTLIEVTGQEGVYYLYNVDGKTYLKWFNGPKNWTTAPDHGNSKEFLIRMEKVN